LKYLAFYFVFFLSIFLILPSTIQANGQNEWIVYFQSDHDAQAYMNLAPEHVAAEHGRILKIIDVSREELLQIPSVKRIEPNYLKKPALSPFNDTYIQQQWYLDAIHFSSIMETYPTKKVNVFFNKPIETSEGTFSYVGQAFSASKMTVETNNEQLSRVSLTLESIQGPWTLSVKDAQGQLVGDNSGELSKLDVLIPKKNYSSLTLEISTEESWDIVPVVTHITGVNHVRIGVLDTGTAMHGDFCENILYSLGKDYQTHQPLALDKNGHGTHVTGIIAACSNNGKGVSGVIGNAPIDVIPFKVLDDEGYGGDFEISQAVEDALKMGIDVINLSLAGKGQTFMLENALREAYLKQVPVIVAAGNWNMSTENVYPASYPYVLTVSSVNENRKKVTSSNYGWEVDLSAPGANILSTYLDQSYGLLTGTSMAAPIVTAATALIKQEFPDWDITRVRSQLLQSTQDILDKGYDSKSGEGMIDLSKVTKSEPLKTIEWLDLEENQPHLKENHLLATSPDMIGKNLSIYQNEKLILTKKIDSKLEVISISPSLSTYKTKILAIVSDQGNVLAMDYVYLNNPNATTISYQDLSKEYWAYNDIIQASKGGYINGYDDGTYKANQHISRRHATMMMNRLFRWESLSTFQSPFTDVTDEMNFSNLSILSASNENIIKGYSNQHFYPEQSLKRSQMALILARALGVDSKPITTNPYQFNDVPNNTEIFMPITNLAELGIITKQEYFRPYETIDRAQFAAMINRTNNYLKNQY
jgi:hypothetical protein